MYWKEQQRGEAAEAAFAKKLKGSKKSDEWQYDLKVEYTIDVKAMKKKKRSDEDVDDSIQWIEFKKNSGKAGWVYGPADYIAFETESYWIIVDRSKLQSWAEGLLTQAEEGRGLYQIYTRKGKKDLIMMIKTLDLCFLSDEILSK